MSVPAGVCAAALHQLQRAMCSRVETVSMQTWPALIPRLQLHGQDPAAASSIRAMCSVPEQATAATQQPPPAPTPPAGLQPPPIQGPMGQNLFWWHTAQHPPRLPWFGGKLRNLPPAKPEVHQAVRDMELDIKKKVDSSFLVNDFLHGARLAIREVTAAVLRRDPNPLTAWLAPPLQRSMLRPPFPSFFTGDDMRPCTNPESVVTDITAVVTGDWGLVPQSLVGQLDSQRADWPGCASLRHQQQQQPHWLVIQVLIHSAHNITAKGSNQPLVVQLPAANPNEEPTLEYALTHNCLQGWFLARGPVPSSPDEPWAAEPWWVLNVLPAAFLPDGCLVFLVDSDPQG